MPASERIAEMASGSDMVVLTALFSGFQEGGDGDWWFSEGVNRSYQYDIGTGTELEMEGCVLACYLDSEAFGVNSIGVDWDGGGGRVSFMIFDQGDECFVNIEEDLDERPVALLCCIEEGERVMSMVLRTESQEVDTGGGDTVFVGPGGEMITVSLDLESNGLQDQ